MIIRMGWPFANDQPDGPAFCKGSSGLAGILQMIIRIGWRFENDYPNWPAFCKWSFRWAGLLQMIIQIGRIFANDPQDWPAFCKWSSGWAGLLQMRIWIGRPFTNVIIRIGQTLAIDHPDVFLSTRFFSIFLSIFSKFLIFLQQTSSSPSKHFFFFKS